MAASPILTLLNRALPNHARDPYQADAREAIAAIFIAAENAETSITRLATNITFFLDDPPTSLAYQAPAASAILTAQQLEHLAFSIRAAVKRLKALEPYIAMFHRER